MQQSVLMMIVSVKLVDHRRDVAGSGIVIKNKSSSSTLNHLDLFDVPLGLRVPDCRSILKLWMDQTSIYFGLNSNATFTKGWKEKP